LRATSRLQFRRDFARYREKLHPEGFGVSGRKSHGDFFKVEVRVVMDIKESDILFSLILKGQAKNFHKIRDKLHENYVCLHVLLTCYTVLSTVCMRCAACLF
jgi:hypothetical protein